MSENSSNPQNPLSKHPKRITVGSVVSFIFGALIFLIGLALLLSPNLFLAGLIYVTLGLYIFPPINGFLIKKTGFRLSGVLTFVLTVVVFLGNMVVMALSSPTSSSKVSSNSFSSVSSTSNSVISSSVSSLVVSQSSSSLAQSSVAISSSLKSQEIDISLSSSSQSSIDYKKELNKLITKAIPLPEFRVLKRDAKELGALTATNNIYKFKGKVIQILIDKNENGNFVSTMRVNIDSIPNQTVWLDYDGKADLFEGDIRNFTALCTGEYTYISKTNYNITLPSFLVYDIK